MPFKSDDAEAAVGEVLATVLVLVSVMWILDTGMPKLRAATCRTKFKDRLQQESQWLITEMTDEPIRIQSRTCSRCQAREKLYVVSSAGKTVTGAKRGKICWRSTPKTSHNCLGWLASN